MALVLGVGGGIITLAVIWVIFLLLSLVFARAQGSLVYVSVVFPILAIIISIILWFAPREDTSPVSQQDVKIYDDTIIPRIAMVTAQTFVALVAGGIYWFCHMVQPVYATPLKRRFR